MSSISRGRRSPVIPGVYPGPSGSGAPGPAWYHEPVVQASTRREAAPGLDGGPASGLAQQKLQPSGELLARLLPIVGEISGLLDPQELFPAIARQLRTFLDH